MAVKPPQRTVCILGGTGFVGRSLTRRLVSKGYSVVIPTRDRQRKQTLLELRDVDLVQGDVHEEQFLRQLLTGSDAAINLVGILNEKGHDGAGFRRAHVELTEKLVRACHEAGTRRLLHMSALQANAERGPSHYLRTKGRAEQALKSLAGEGIKYTVFQPSVIFGPEDSFINRFARLLRFSPVLPLPKLGARFAPVFVEDVAEAFSVALENSTTYGRTYELCGPDVYTFGEILAYIQATLGIKRVVLEVPDLLGELQAGLIDYLVPGKPFSLDNFRSLSVASVCTEDGLAALGIKARPMTTVVPQYLKA
jgi:NADH dehydrogenase